MPDSELLTALIEIEQVMQLQPPIGASELPPKLRFFRVLALLQQQICPKASELVDLANKPEGEIVIAIADCLIATLGQIPIPVTTVAKHVAKIGVKKFCKDQTALLE